MGKLSIAGFTNLGYLLHSAKFEPIDVDMNGQTVVVTGGTGGIGRAAAHALSQLGARVIVVSRTQAKLDELAASLGPGTRTIQADLSLMSEVRRVAALLEEEARIDVLINNVGVLIPERQVTDEGLEMTLAVDLAGHFLLTNLLMPKLIESAPARVVNVTSGGMYSERIRPDDLEFSQGSYTGTAAYARAKRGQVILTEIWAEKLRGSGVIFHSMHPGWARTDGVSNSLPTFNLVMSPLLRSPEQGADTIVWLAASDDAAKTTGKFWFDRKEASTHMLESTKETQSERDELWSRLVEITGADLASPIGRIAD